LRILDVGTGSGCLLLSALSEFPRAFGIGLDISPKALQVAKQNAERHHLSERCEFIQQDLRELTTASISSSLFDVVLCNPPYIPHHETHLIAPDVLQYEPHLALFSSPLSSLGSSEEDLGLEMYQAMEKAMPFLLTKKPERKTTVLFEIGSNKQAIAVKELFHPKTLYFICFLKDLTQKTRGLVFTRC
jgi:release factor glutamine methyltransferase